MNGWTTLTYIYYAGLAFIALWILGTNLKEGLWGNALLAFNWLIAAFGAWALWLPGMKIALDALKSGDQLTILAVAMGLYLALFLVFFVGLRLATDALSKVKVSFHPIADKIGSGLFCVLLFLGIAAASLPVIVVLQMGKPAS